MSGLAAVLLVAWAVLAWEQGQINPSPTLPHPPRIPYGDLRRGTLPKFKVRIWRGKIGRR